MKLVTITLLSAALIGGMLRRPEESPLQVTEDEAERLIEAGVAEKPKKGKADADAAAPKAAAETKPAEAKPAGEQKPPSG